MDFTHLLQQQVDTVEAPKPLPVGTFQFLITGHKFDESAQKKTPYLQYTCKPIAPGADVDTSMLPEGWNEREMRLDFYLTQDALYRLREFFEAIGLNVQGRPFSAVIPEAVNMTFTGTVTHSPSKDGKKVYANITGYAAG